MKAEELISKADDPQFKNVTPDVDKLPPTQEAPPPPPENGKPPDKGFTFEEFVASGSFAGAQAQPNGQSGATGQPVTGSQPTQPNPQAGITGFKAIGRIFEKVLDEVCISKHGLHLKDIGASIANDDLKLASELYGEGASKGELPVIPPVVTLIALIALIFAYPTYKVFTFEKSRELSRIVDNISEKVVTANVTKDDLMDNGINPRTKKPYVRGKYNTNPKRRRK